MKSSTAEKLLLKVQNDYNDIAYEFSATRIYPWPEFNVLAEYIQNNDNVLDIGCGNGRLNESFKNKKIYYNGIDNAAKLIKEAQKKYPRQFFRVGDILKLPFVKNEFNIAIAIAILHHVPSMALRIKALREINRVLKKNSYLLMTNWNLWQPKYRYLIWQTNLKKFFYLTSLDKNDIFVPWKSPRGILLQKRYYHAFTEQELKRLADLSDFKIIKQYFSYQGKASNPHQAYNILSIWQKK